MAEVLIEGRRLDVKEGLDFSFNYSIADIRDPNKRSTSFSKTIKCPSTKRNDELFGQIYDVNISNPFNPSDTNIEVNFNPNKKAKARVIQDGVTVMEGVVQLRTITINNGRYDYEVVFIGNLVTFFSELGKKKLREIDFSDLDHTFDATTVSSSWTNTSGYVYPMIDYGDEFETNNSLNRWRVRQFRPALFVKTIVDRIFDYAGFTYDSTLFDSARFRDLIIPFGGEQLYADNTVTDNRKFKASQVGVDGAYTSSDFFNIGTGTEARTLRLTNDSTGGNFDTGNNFNTSTWVYDVPNDGLYSFTTSAEVNLQRVSVNTNVYGTALNMKLQIIRTDTSLNTTVLAETVQPFNFSGSTLAYDETLNLSVTSPQSVLLDGDKVQFRLVLDFNSLQITTGGGSSLPNSTLFTDFDLTTQSSSGYNTPSQTIFEGDPITIESTVPDVTMVDFMMSIIKMFNLYVTPDPLNDTNLLIETRDEYYAEGTTRDWTNKLARDRQVTLKPLGLLSARKYIYAYKEDNDYYNQRYQTSHLETYGTRDYEVDNDFLNNEKEVYVIFSPTPMQIEGNTSRFVPRIYDNDISEGAKPTESNIRILYYERKICIPSWEYYSDVDGVVSSEITYPYAGHLDDPLNPSFDLNFGIPEELYYQANGYTGTLIYTNANLYNLYHRSHIDEITDKDSKIMMGEFYLDAWDVEKLDFRDQILIDNSYWRLNRVNDYNPFKEGLTKVELIKVKDIIPQDVETFTVGSIGTVGSGGTEETTPFVDRRTKQESAYNFNNGTVSGRFNRVSQSAQQFKVVGNRNFIGDSSKNITIIGSDNYVSSGLENVTIINSDNQEVFKSNTTIIDGKRQWQYVETDADYSAKDREVVLADSSKAAPPITITLPTLSDNLWVCVKKIDSSASNVDITAGVSGFIDGSATYSLTSQYESVELYCDGSNWHIRSNA